MRWDSLLQPILLSILIHFPATILPLVCAESAHVSHAANVEDDTSVSYPLQLENEIRDQHVAVKERLLRQQVVGVKKMSDDEGEKFFLEYWSFRDDPTLASGPAGSGGRVWSSKAVRRDPIRTVDDSHFEDSDVEGSFESWMKNSSSLLDKPPLLPPLSLHDQEPDSFFRIVGRQLKLPINVFSPFFKRDFQCPSGTFNCTSHPGSCCSNGDTCVVVTDTSLGNVGCCPQGMSCSGGITSCMSGYASCPASLGGGCCIPGYSCVSGGCVLVSTSTVIETLTPSASSTSSTAAAFPSSLTTTSRIAFVASTSTTNALPPVRPTTEFTTQTTIITSVTSASSISVCPMGFYACSAVYQGGCCRIGRNCDTTSCPAVTGATAITSDGITIEEPTGTSTIAVTACASSWFSCADTAGGGCCPSGFACGSSCTATGSSAATVAKSQPVSGADRRYIADTWLLAACLTTALYLASATVGLFI